MYSNDFGMVDKSIGITGGLHKKLQQIKNEHGYATMSGIACYALDEMLKRKTSVNKILERIISENAEGLGARRLDRSNLPK